MAILKGQALEARVRAAMSGGLTCQSMTGTGINMAALAGNHPGAGLDRLAAAAPNASAPAPAKPKAPQQGPRHQS